MLFKGKYIMLIFLLYIMALFLNGCSNDGLNKTGYYSLTSLKEGQGTIMIKPEKDSYPVGSTVQLEAIAADYWEFDCWEGTGLEKCGENSSVSIVIDGDMLIRGVFKGKEEIKETGETGSVIFSNDVILENMDPGTKVKMREIIAPDITYNKEELSIYGKVVDISVLGDVSIGVLVKIPVSNLNEDTNKKIGLYHYNKLLSLWEKIPDSKIVDDGRFIQGTAYNFSPFAVMAEQDVDDTTEDNNDMSTDNNYYNITIFEFPRFKAKYRLISRNPETGNIVDEVTGTTTVSVIDNGNDYDPASNPSGLGRNFLIGRDIPLQTSVSQEGKYNFKYTPAVSIETIVENTVSYDLGHIVDEIQKITPEDWKCIAGEEKNWNAEYNDLEYDVHEHLHYSKISHDPDDYPDMKNYIFSTKLMVKGDEVQSDAGDNAGAGLNFRSYGSRDHYYVLWNKKGIYLYYCNWGGEADKVLTSANIPITYNEWHKLEIEVEEYHFIIKADENQVIEYTVSNKEDQIANGGYGPLTYRCGARFKEFSGKFNQRGTETIAGDTYTASIQSGESFKKVSSQTYGDLLRTAIENWENNKDEAIVNYDFVEYFAETDNVNISLDRTEDSEDYIIARIEKEQFDDINCIIEVENLSGEYGNRDVVNMKYNPAGHYLNVSTTGQYSFYKESGTTIKKHLVIPLPPSKYSSYTLASEKEVDEHGSVSHPARTTFVVIDNRNWRIDNLSWEYSSGTRDSIPIMTADHISSIHHNVNGESENDSVLVNF